MSEPIRGYEFRWPQTLRELSMRYCFAALPVLVARVGWRDGMVQSR